MRSEQLDDFDRSEDNWHPTDEPEYDRPEATNRRGQTFLQWKRLIDLEVEKKVGLSIDDLPDVPLYDWFEDNATPKVAAARAIKAAKE